MHLSAEALGCIADVLAVFDKTSRNAPYRSGWALVNLFNTVGFQDEYDSSVGVCSPGFTSRHAYAVARLHALNDKPELSSVIEAALDRRLFEKRGIKPTHAAQQIRNYLEPEGYSVLRAKGTYRVHSLVRASVRTDLGQASTFVMNAKYLQEQQSKSETKLANGDPDGAITNARTLLEAMLLEIWKGLSDDAPGDYNGDVARLYKRVVPLLDLGARNDKKVEASVRQVLGGLSGVVSGIAEMRNVMSDAHARVSPAEDRHARLAINAVATICSFLLDSCSIAVRQRHNRSKQRPT